MDANADTVESVCGIDVFEQLTGMEVLGEGFFGTLEAEDEAFEVGVAIGHEFNGLFLCLVVEALLHAHPRGKHELRRLHLNIVLFLLGVQYISLEVAPLPLPRHLLDLPFP
jgi:hypothetical protein